MNRTNVSVLIPVYNSEAYVGKAIRSVLAQTYSDFEIVVLDDGSDDGSARVARSFGDPRVRVYRRDEHEGVAATRNHLLLAASTSLIAWLDADDVALPERLAKQVDYLERHPDVALVACSFAEMDAQGQNLRQHTLPKEHDDLMTRLLHAGSLPTSSVLMRRQAIETAGGFDVELGYACEFDLFLKVSERARLAALRETLVKSRVHARAVAYTRRHERRECIDEARRRAALRRWEKPILLQDKEAALPAATPDTTGVGTEVAVAVRDGAEIGASVTSADVVTIGNSEAQAAGAVAGPAIAGQQQKAEAGGDVPSGRRRRRRSRKGKRQQQAGDGIADGGSAAGTQQNVVATDPPAMSNKGAGSFEPAVAGVAIVAAAEGDVDKEDAAGAAAVSTVITASDSSDGKVDSAVTAPRRDPLVAVVLPVTGRQGLEAVRSVLDQSLTDLVVAVVATQHDDGLERGLEILNDNRVVLLEAENAKRSRALNIGVLATRSRYISYLSESSVYRAEHLDRLTEAAEAERLGFVYADLGIATKSVAGSIATGQDFDAGLLLKENYIPTEGVLHRRDLLHDVGIFNEGLLEGMEWELWVYLTRTAPTRRLAKVTVDRVVATGRNLRSEVSPARVRRYLADKFNARRASVERTARNEVLSQPLMHDGDAVARAQERFRHGDWAGAAAELVDAASRSFGALGQLFARRYPEREVPGDGQLSVPQPPAVESRPRTRGEETSGEEPRPIERPREGRVHPAVIANRQSSGTVRPAPLSVATASTGWSNSASAPSGLNLGEEPERAAAEHGGMAAGSTSPSPSTKARPSSWLYTQSGLVGTGRSRSTGRRMGTGGLGAPTFAAPSGRVGRGRKSMNTLAETPPCPNCGHEQPAVAYRAGWYRVLDCEGCGIAFSHPRMEPGLAGRFFSDRRGSPVPPGIRSVDDLAGTAFDRSRELGWVQRSVTEGRLVEVGCAWGYTLVQAAELGFEVLGTELSRPLARIARERFGVEVKELDLGDISIEDGSIDAVLAIHVVQHMVDFQSFMRDAHRILRTGGVLVGSVPNFDSYLREALGRRWAWIDPESQPNHFRPGTLLRELETVGFSVDLWTSEGLYGDEAIQEFVSAEEAQGLGRSGRGSEIGFIATKRVVH